jgi:hypothetical protein
MARVARYSTGPWQAPRKSACKDRPISTSWGKRGRQHSQRQTALASESYKPTDETGLDSVADIEETWTPSVAARKESEEKIRCQVVVIEGEEATCTVFMGDYELPRVSFPAWVIKRKRLRVGGRFLWVIRDADHIRPRDIDTNIPQSDEMTAAEKQDHERLYEKVERRLAEIGGMWPEYTGDGT